ncbi:sensor histidine kinase [Kibdelosporangium lantanae]
MTASYGNAVKKSYTCWPEPHYPAKQRPPVAVVVFPALFLLFLAEPVVDAIANYSGWVTVVVIVSVLLYAATYIFAMWRGLYLPKLGRVGLVLLLTVFPVVLALLMDPADLTYLTFAIVAAILQLPAVVGLVYGVAAAVAEMVLTGVVHGGADYRSGVILLVITLTMFGVRMFEKQSGELALAREEIKTLAVAEERARVARDLHDVLGHSLTTITLKAGLARRILESSRDVDRAVAEVHDLERLSRQALTEIRATVSGYRKVSLPAEIAGAKAALIAAGIDADLPQAVDDVPGELQEPFGYVLREGVTNVIRHSGASRCQIRLGESWIEVTDNGSGTSTPDGHGGNGLSGLRERLGKVGGRLTARAGGEGGFVLRAEVVA